MERVTLELSGMTCGHCVARVTKALQGMEGVQVEKVAINRVTLDIDPRHTTPEAVAQALDGVGYPVVAASAA